MTINTLLTTAGAPACRCDVCARRRAFRLAQALRQKYSPAPEVID